MNLETRSVQTDRLAPLRLMLGAISVRRWLMLFAGLVCFGFGIALMVQAKLGLGDKEAAKPLLERAVAIGTKNGRLSVLIPGYGCA